MAPYGSAHLFLSLIRKSRRFLGHLKVRLDTLFAWGIMLCTYMSRYWIFENWLLKTLRKICFSGSIGKYVASYSAFVWTGWPSLVKSPTLSKIYGLFKSKNYDDQNWHFCPDFEIDMMINSNFLSQLVRILIIMSIFDQHFDFWSTFWFLIYILLMRHVYFYFWPSVFLDYTFHFWAQCHYYWQNL